MTLCTRNCVICIAHVSAGSLHLGNSRNAVSLVRSGNISLEALNAIGILINLDAIKKIRLLAVSLRINHETRKALNTVGLTIVRSTVVYLRCSETLICLVQRNVIFRAGFALILICVAVVFAIGNFLVLIANVIAQVKTVLAS